MHCQELFVIDMNNGESSRRNLRPCPVRAVCKRSESSCGSTATRAVSARNRWSIACSVITSNSTTRRSTTTRPERSPLLTPACSGASVRSIQTWRSTRSSHSWSTLDLAFRSPHQREQRQQHRRTSATTSGNWCTHFGDSHPRDSAPRWTSSPFKLGGVRKNRSRVRFSASTFVADGTENRVCRVILLSQHFPFWAPCDCPLRRRRCHPRACLSLPGTEEREAECRS